MCDSLTPELQSLVDTAKIAEHAERYEDMAHFMKQFVMRLSEQNKPIEDKQLSDEQRNLLSVAYKNVVGTRRTAYRTIENERGNQKNCEKEGSDWKSKACEEYNRTVVNELNEICDDVISLLDKYLIVAAQAKCADRTGDKDALDSQAQSLIFYQKMKGDYYRYKVEVATSDADKGELANQSEKAYKEASREAEENLGAIHPIRLGLALNFSVFYYEIKEKKDMAKQLAKRAFDCAVEELDRDDGRSEKYKDSSLILQLLRDNLTLWTSIDNDEGNADDDQQEAD